MSEEKKTEEDEEETFPSLFIFLIEKWINDW